jgi:superfamily II DNA or RNA helicase
MPVRASRSGSELFIVDNSDTDWKVQRYLRDWCQISKGIDIATGNFEIGGLLALEGEWQKVDQIRILMGADLTLRTSQAFASALAIATETLDESLEVEKLKNDFLTGVPAIVRALRDGKILCRVYRKDKFHAKAYITHARIEVVGSSALVGSSNLSRPGLTQNVELNVQITGGPVSVLQEWFDEHWQSAEDVTPTILRTIERHVAAFTPFDIYARALQEFFRGRELTAGEWEAAGGTAGSRVYPVLDKYQQDGYQNLMRIAGRYGGALLCDGVGLGKTFVGLMLIERLIVKERKRVLLLVPKGARQSVWEPAIRRHLAHVGGGDFSSLVILSHTDLSREGDFLARFEAIKAKADVIVVDEAHNFRNPGTRGFLESETGSPSTGIQPTTRGKPSRYWRLFDLAKDKQLFLLTATPVNNQLDDLRHMLELFTQRDDSHFKETLGIHSLRAHFVALDKALGRALGVPSMTEGAETNLEEARNVLSDDNLFNALVVQRSRAYVKESQELAGGRDRHALFPKRNPPQVVPYSLRKTFGRLLDKIEKAFNKKAPLFALPIYYPLGYYKGTEAVDKFVEGRQQQVVALIRTQFLKRFESSVVAFEASCERLFLHLLAFVTRNATEPREKKRLERWSRQHEELLARVSDHQRAADEDVEEDLIPPEFFERVEELPRDSYDVDTILDETYLDIEQLADFLRELDGFTPAHDDKLQALIRLLNTDEVLRDQKVLIFSEFADTARYVARQLTEAGVSGVEEIDGESKVDRAAMVRRFAPYYNGSSSAEILRAGDREVRVLISTDILSEGLNLQDATRVINYDLHWNPVRLMQRIGRVDRRMDPAIEARIIEAHPGRREFRGHVGFWNFLPPDELDTLLRLYSRVSHKTLRISRTLGIEGRKLLTPDDEFEALREFNASYEGILSGIEAMHLEYEQLLVAHPGLTERLNALPNKAFSGKANPSEGTRALFLCYSLPAPERTSPGETGSEWRDGAGGTAWYLYDFADAKIADMPETILRVVRSAPETPRRTELDQPTLAQAREAIEKHIKNTYLKRMMAPVGVRPVLKAWMELN